MSNIIRYINELEESGLSRKQAETTVSVFSNFMENNLATKDELKNLEVRVNHKFADLEARIDHRFESFEYRMTIKFGLMQAATIGILAAFIKLL